MHASPKLKMMKKYLLLAVIAFAATFSFSQDSLIPRRVAIRTNIVDIRGSYAEAYLQNLTDSGIYLTHESVKVNSGQLYGSQAKWFDYKSIEQLTFKRKGSAGRGALIGLVTGAFAGAIIGFATFQSPPKYDVNNPIATALNDSYFWGPQTAGENAAFCAVAGGLGGALIGTAIGMLAKKTFIIKGSKERYRDMNNRLSKRLFRKYNHNNSQIYTIQP
jgi:hypothetical protein